MITIPASYKESQQRFHNDLTVIQTYWPAARMNSHFLPGEEDLSIDWISADPIQAKERLLILTTGEHGIEGYVGSAMLQVFVEEFLPRLDPKRTGLLIIHAINPWGMKHHRRVNANNVDLNRNFVDDFNTLPGLNPDYTLLSPLLEPKHPLQGVFGEKVFFLARTASMLLRYGVVRMREATLRGQYDNPHGVYFGGRGLQEETIFMKDLIPKTLTNYGHLLHLDLHSGYGPRMQMSLVNSPLEKMSARETQDKYDVPRVMEANPNDFYSIQGDMIDWEYLLVKNEFPQMHHFATTFEFGTFGDSLLAAIRSLRSIVFRNQTDQFGASPSALKWIDREYEEHYCPSESGWLLKGKADACLAFNGILKAEGYFK